MVCPNCNGFYTKKMICPKCFTEMADQGKISDFYDDYSPYMDIDLLKLEDGKIGQCWHLYICNECGELEEVLVN